ncbi:MAG: M43 family zinc metalloprotease [Bacteroidota bacterium]|nr:M43 family zinc metalloprotease [Bacteroidota bacterium]
MRVFIFILALLTTSFSSLAQTTEPCSADALHAAEMATSEPYARNFDAVRAAVQRLQASSNRNMDTYTLPVVVHVIHRGSPVGVEENITDAQILSAIDGMNDDFRNRVSDSEGADTFIQFEMARRTPAGEPTNGIVRVNGNSVPGYAQHGISNGQDDDAADQSAVKSLTTWYGDEYINIFVVPEINGNNGGNGIQGYAYLGPTNDERDGLVVLYNAFGLVGELKPGRTLNKTVTHEMGHHLSLYHTFSNTTSCTSETNCETQGDLVCDTPSTISNNSGCTSPNCDGAQVENYMDYAQETCKNMFTAGQRDRMRACLESSRSSLLESLGGLAVTAHDLTIAGLGNVGESTCLPSLTPTVIVTNFGTQTVTGFELTTSVNGHSPFTTIHDESVESGASVEVMLPELALAADTNELDLEVRLLGNFQDDFPGNDQSVERIVLAQSDYWTMTLNTDTWANEISWRIEDSDGEAIMHGGDYPVNAATYVSSGCVPVGCHTLIMEDTNGDGLCSIDFGDDGICDIGGSMNLTNAAGDVLVELDNTTNNYGYEGSWEVCASEVSEMEGCADENNNGICDAAEISVCQDVTACNFTPGAILDDGSCTFAEQYYDCYGQCHCDEDGDGVCCELETDGCTDATACNYVENASDDDGSCEFTSCVGCTDPNGCNYDSSATISGVCDYPATHYNCDGSCTNDVDGDGVCDPFEIAGCDDVTACDYDAAATDNDGSCTYAESYYNCDGECIQDSDGDGICNELEVAGCQDQYACNFDASATDNDGSCTYPETYFDCEGVCLNDFDGDGVCDELEIAGCDDETACDYDANATDNDGSCTYPAEFYTCEGCIHDTDNDQVCDELEVTGCQDIIASNYNPEATDPPASGEECSYEAGCTVADACNYSAEATVANNDLCFWAETYYDCYDECIQDSDGDGVCDELEIAGCDDASACNFQMDATDNDGSCEYAETFFDCDGACLNDTDGDGVCDELEIAGCEDADACNFDATATDSNGSCTYAEPYYDCEGNCLNDLDGDGICDEVDDEVSTDNVGEFSEAPELNLFPNPMSPEHTMVFVSGLDNDQTAIRVLASDGRVVWQGTGIVKSPGVVGYPIRESIAPGTYFIQVGTSTPSGNIPLMVW